MQTRTGNTFRKIIFFIWVSLLLTMTISFVNSKLVIIIKNKDKNIHEDKRILTITQTEMLRSLLNAYIAKSP